MQNIVALLQSQYDASSHTRISSEVHICNISDSAVCKISAEYTYILVHSTMHCQVVHAVSTISVTDIAPLLDLSHMHLAVTAKPSRGPQNLV